MTMDFQQFSAISFDCYGTLIDWEAGILPILRALLASRGQSLPDAEILELYGEFEAQAESGPYQSYRAVLQSVVRSFADRFHFDASASEVRSLADSVHAWPPFPDTVAALRQLQKRYKLVIISNIDDDLFAATRKHLEVEFDAVITAEQARSYKPSLNNFQMALRTLALSPRPAVARCAEHLSRCRARTVAGNLDGMGEPKVGSCRDWRGASLAETGIRETARSGGSRSGEPRGNGYGVTRGTEGWRVTAMPRLVHVGTGSGQDLFLNGHCDQLGLVVDVKFAHQVELVRFDRLDADPECAPLLSSRYVPQPATLLLHARAASAYFSAAAHAATGSAMPELCSNAFWICGLIDLSPRCTSRNARNRRAREYLSADTRWRPSATPAAHTPDPHAW